MGYRVGKGRVYKRGRFWWIAYSLKGREYCESSGSEHEEDARQLLAERLEAVRAQVERPQQMAHWSFAQYLLEYKASLPHIVYATSGSRGALGTLKKYFSDYSVQDMTQDVMDSYVRQRKRVGRSNAQIVLELDVLTRLLKLHPRADILFYIPLRSLHVATAKLRQEGLHFLPVRRELRETELCIDKALLERLILQRSSVLHMRCGIYFLIDQETVVYVGQSTDIEERIREHRNHGEKVFDAYAYFEFPVAELDEREAWFIQLLSPRDNRKLTGIPRRTKGRALEVFNGASVKFPPPSAFVDESVS